MQSSSRGEVFAEGFYDSELLLNVASVAQQCVPAGTESTGPPGPPGPGVEYTVQKVTFHSSAEPDCGYEDIKHTLGDNVHGAICYIY